MNKIECSATKIDYEEELCNAGDYQFVERLNKLEMVGMDFVCPCGCGSQSFIKFGSSKGDRDNPQWQWNGNLETPTLTPSLKKTTGCMWHGYLTNGVFIEV